METITTEHGPVKVGDHVHCVVGERTGWAVVGKLYDTGRLSVAWLPGSTFVQAGVTYTVDPSEVTAVARPMRLPD